MTGFALPHLHVTDVEVFVIYRAAFVIYYFMAKVFVYHNDCDENEIGLSACER